MDNSSRNIVKFIVTITAAALLIMAARFYAQSQEEPMPVVAEESAETETAPVEVTADDPTGETGLENPDGEVIEEDAELIMGEPSMNLETGGATVYLPQQAPAQTEDEADAPVEQ